MENDTERIEGKSARKCWSSFCGNLLKTWDDHALCPSCRNCNITDNACYICKDWNEEEKKKAMEGIKPRIKVEPGSQVTNAPVFSIDEDDDDDDIIFLDSNPITDTSWIKKEKPDCRMQKSNIASNDSEVIVILSDDDESDEEAVILESSTKEQEPSKQTIDQGKLFKNVGSTSPTTARKAQEIVRDKDLKAASGSSGVHSLPQLLNGIPTSENTLEIKLKEYLSEESPTSTKNLAKNEQTRTIQQLLTNTKNLTLREEGKADRSKDEREVIGTNIVKSCYQSSPSPAVQEHKSTPLNEKDVVVEPSVKSTNHANEQTNLSETSGGHQNHSSAPTFQEQKAKTKPAQVDDIMMEAPSVSTAPLASNKQINKTNATGNLQHLSILPEVREQFQQPKPPHHVDKNISVVDTPADIITLLQKKKDNLPEQSAKRIISSGSPAIQEQNVQSVALHVKKNVLRVLPSNIMTGHTPIKTGNQTSGENRKDLNLLNTDVEMIETSNEPPPQEILMKKQRNQYADNEGEECSTSEVKDSNDNDEMANETQKTSMVTSHPKDLCRANNKEGAGLSKSVQKTPLVPVEENKLSELCEDDYDSDGWEISSVGGSDSGERSKNAELIPVLRVTAGAGNTVAEMAKLIPPESLKSQDVEGSSPVVLRPLKIIPAAGSSIPVGTMPSVLPSSDVIQKSIKPEKTQNEEINHDVNVSNSGKDKPPVQKQWIQTRSRRKGRENSKQEDNLPDVVVNEQRGKSPVVKPVFNCHRCFESFKDKDLLTHHLDNHPEVTRIMCVYCNRNFQKQSYLKTHLKRCYKRKKSLVRGRSPKKASSGRQSGIASDNKSLYDRVKLKSLGKNGKIKQLFAEKMLNKSKSQTKKKTTMDQRKSHPCNNRQESTLSKNQCPVCKLMLSSRSNVSRHVQIMHKTSIAGFKETVTEPDEELYWKCPVCYKSKYLTKAVITRHLYRQHYVKADEEYPNLSPLPKEKALQVIYGCQHCSEFFPSLSKFKQHTMEKGKASVHCKKTYRCNLCLKNFSRITLCTNHIREHLGIFKCSVRGCFEMFPNKKAREEHEKTHDDATEKKVPSPKKSLKVEGKGHLNAAKKPAPQFKCRRCAKKFDREFLRAKHELEHTNSDPWHCYICFKIFYLDRSMVNHMETSHPGVKYCKKCYCILAGKFSKKRLCVDCDKKKDSSNLKCGLCKTEFSSVFDLAQHILNHSSDNSAPDVPLKLSTTKPGGSAVNAENMVAKSIPWSIVEAASGKRKIGRPSKASKDESRILPDSSPERKISSGDRGKQKSCPGSTMLRSGKSVQTNNVIHDNAAGDRSRVVAGQQVLTRSLVKYRGVPLETGEAQSRKRSRSVDHVDASKSKLLKTSVKSPSKSPGALQSSCLKCGKKNIPADELTGHARTHLQSRSEYSCNGCSKFFADIDSMEEHLAVVHSGACSYVVGKLAYECRGCAKRFLNIMEARKHVLSTNSSCMLECCECGKEYAKQGDLMVHMINVHSQYLECDQCLAQFTRPSDLDSHIQQHLSNSLLP